MPKIIRTLIQICLFRAKPQDLNPSVNLLAVAIGVTLVLFIVRNNHLMVSTNILAVSLVQVGLLGLGLRLLLVLFSKSDRWLQAATALYGCCAVTLLVIILFIMLFSGVSSGGLLLIQVAVIASGLWYFAVIIFIIRETLEISSVLAFFIALALELFFTFILLQLFGEQLL